MTRKKAIKIVNEILNILHIKYLDGQKAVALKSLILDIDHRAREECAKIAHKRAINYFGPTEQCIGASYVEDEIRATIEKGEK